MNKEQLNKVCEIYSTPVILSPRSGREDPEDIEEVMS